jgi:phosphoglycerate kinase
VTSIPGLDDLDAEGQRVLVRADLNVPLEKGKVTDDLRIVESLPTIRRLREAGARTVLMSHLGRPKGKVVEERRLAPVAARLSDLLGVEVAAASDVVGPDARGTVKRLGPGDVALLENLRFEPGEEANDPDFARRLADLGDAYVNDAFGAAHRAHASIVGVPEILEHAVAGLLMRKEIDSLSRLLDVGEDDRPYTTVLGGAKVSDKIDVIDNLLGRSDRLCIGGAMCFTFLAANRAQVGDSRVEQDHLDTVARLMRDAKEQGVQLLLPVDIVAAEAFEPDADHRRVPAEAIPEGFMGLDIGEETVTRFAAAITESRTVFWNGPMGVFEWEAFAAGTEGVARAVAECPGYTVIGGGDSAAAIRRLGLDDQVSHVSTGGGASLQFLAGTDLPGLAVLRRNADG